MAEGKYTAILHADEVYEKTLVEKQVAVLEESPDVGVVFPEASLIDGSGFSFGETRAAHYVGHRKGETVFFDFETLFPIILRFGNFLLCSGAMVRTAIYKTEILSWQVNEFGTSVDLDVWLRILERHKIALILEKLMRTRTTLTQASYLELKRNTQRADMFLVLDYYREKYRKSGMVTHRDIEYYEALQRMDTARRAMNLYLTGCRQETKELLQHMPRWALFRFAFDSKRGLLTFFLVCYLKLMLLPGLNALGMRFLHYYVIKTRK